MKKLGNKVNYNNIKLFIELKKQYYNNYSNELKKEINRFIDDVINNDKKFYSKLSSYNLSNNELNYIFEYGLK